MIINLEPQKSISKTTFTQLVKTNCFYCVSIYTPFKDKINDVFAKDVLEEYEKTLRDKFKQLNMSIDNIENFLHPIKHILRKKEIWESSEWNYSDCSFAIFISDTTSFFFILKKVTPRTLHLTPNFYLLPLFEKQKNIEVNLSKVHPKDRNLKSDSIVTKLERIMPMSFNGKIKRLYVSTKEAIFGVYDHDNVTTLIDQNKNSRNISLLNLAALQTYLSNGEVVLFDPESISTKRISAMAILK